MSIRTDVVTSVTLINKETINGRFKWPSDISEKKALHIVLNQFTKNELHLVKTILLDPVSFSNLSWLPTKTCYTFKKNV